MSCSWLDKFHTGLLMASISVHLNFFNNTSAPCPNPDYTTNYKKVPSVILGCTALKAVWDTLSFILASPSITRIMSFHSALLGLEQSLDETVTAYP